MGSSTPAHRSSTPPPAELPANSSGSTAFTSSMTSPTRTQPPTASAMEPRYPSPPPAAPTRSMAASMSSSATASSTLATTSTAPAFPNFSATTSALRWAGPSRRTSSSSSATTKAIARTWANRSLHLYPTARPASATYPTPPQVSTNPPPSALFQHNSCTYGL